MPNVIRDSTTAWCCVRKSAFGHGENGQTMRTSTLVAACFRSPMLRAIIIAPSVIVTAALVATLLDRYWHSGHCLAPFRQMLIDSPCGLPLTVHEYGFRSAFETIAPGGKAWPDPRDIRLTLVTSMSIRLSTLIVWMSTACAVFGIGSATFIGNCTPAIATSQDKTLWFDGS